MLISQNKGEFMDTKLRKVLLYTSQGFFPILIKNHKFMSDSLVMLIFDDESTMTTDVSNVLIFDNPQSEIINEIQSFTNKPLRVIK